jgi:hypothetical protein
MPHLHLLFRCISNLTDIPGLVCSRTGMTTELMSSGVSVSRVHDRTGLILNSTRNRRCRMQSLSDASLHFGWIKEFANNICLIEVASGKPVKQGEFLFFEVSGASSLVTFVGYVLTQQANSIRIQVTSNVEDKPLKSESRMRINTIQGSILQNDGMFPIRVGDISDNGIGFETEEFELKAGQCLATLFSPEGTVTLSVDVRHLRTDRETQMRRGGAAVLDMDRVSRARWTRLFVE